jgi:hypothetical protein
MHLAQVNIARMRAPLDTVEMSGFVVRIDEVNALADGSPGFVWRLRDESGNNTYLRPYDDDRMLFNLSVWQSIEHLKEFVFKTAHASVMRRRGEWFEKFAGAYVALWWVPEWHRPSVDEAKARLAHLEANGPSPEAFTFTSLARGAPPRRLPGQPGSR